MKIHAIETGIVHVKSDFILGSAAAGSTAAFMFKLFTDKKWVDLPIYAWVIEHDEGVIVVDTGDLADTKSNFVSQSTYDIQPEQAIGPQLEALGIRPHDVSKVILTHLHGDHVNGLAYFQGIDTYLGADEYAFYKSTWGGIFSRRTTRLPKWFDPKPLVARNEPFETFPFAYSLTKAGDVVAVPTPGHTAGHISVVARKDGVNFFMAGDITYNLAGLLSQTLQGPSLDEKDHPVTLRRTLDFARAQPTVYLPAHDWESGNRLNAVSVVNSRQIAAR